MQKKWDEMWRRHPGLASRSDDAWSCYDGQQALLPLYGALSRLLLVGGGGAGKSRIINRVLTPVLEAYYGPAGVMKEAPSNKAARLIKGSTLHAANGLFGNSSLLTPHLRLKPRAKRYVRQMGRLGAKIFDEFSQINSRLFHADAYMTSVARARAASDSAQASETSSVACSEGVVVEASKYTDPEHSWGAMPVVVVSGDELQFPCVPQARGLLASIVGTGDEQKCCGEIVFQLRRSLQAHHSKAFPRSDARKHPAQDAAEGRL